MAEPTLPRWADGVVGDTANMIAPSGAHQSTGWVKEKPVRQIWNWLLYQAYAWLVYLQSYTKNENRITLLTTTKATWTGANLILNAQLDVIFREDAGARRINRLPAATYSFTDGDCLVFMPDRTNASPVTLTLASSYGALVAGKYVIVAESSLTLTNVEKEMILFRRRGSTLESVQSGRFYPQTSYVYPDGHNGAAQEGYGGSVQTTDGTVTEIANIPVAETDHWTVEALVSGQKSDGSQRGSWKLVASFYRNTAGNVTQNGQTSMPFGESSDSAYTADFVADTVNQLISLRVTGKAATTVNWVASVAAVKTN